MDLNKIIQEIDSKKIKPVYFLCGDEPFYIDLITDVIENGFLSESDKQFNQVVLYGKDVTVLQISDLAKRYPMMASHQVVIIKEAQDVNNIQLLAPYLSNPLQSTVLVICYKYKTIDKRKKDSKEFVDAIQKNGVWFESKKLYENQIASWITNYVASRNLQIENKAAAVMADHIGADLSRIVNEIDKLIITLPEGKNIITALHVEKMIGISKDFNTYELLDAIVVKNSLKAYRIIDYFSKNPRSGGMIYHLSVLYNYFSNLLAVYYLNDQSEKGIASALSMAPWQAKNLISGKKNYKGMKVFNIIGLIREFDAKAKGFESASTNDSELMKELVYKILN